MKSYYVLPSGTDATSPPPTAITRASALGTSLIIGDPSSLVSVYPSVVIMSSSQATVVIPDDSGQATLSSVQAAQTNATNAESAKQTNIDNSLQAIKNAATGLSAAQSQARADLATLSASTDALAPIVTRLINGSRAIADAVANLLVAQEIIEAP